MSITPSVLIDLAKRTARFGQVGNNSDQPAQDLLVHLRLVLRRIWRAADWDWSLDEIEETLAANTSDLTLESTSGEITELYIDGQDGALQRFSRRQYLDWKKQTSDDDRGDVVGYIHRGRDGSGNIQLRFFSTPSEAKTILGWAKKRFTAPTQATIATPIDYFPDDMEDVIFDLLLAKAYALAGDAKADGAAREAERALRALISEENAQADLQTKSPPPDYVMHKLRKRSRGGTGVY